MFKTYLLNLCYLTFRYNEGEVHFNLMAVVSDRKLILERRLLSLPTEELVSLSILLTFSVNTSVYQIMNVFLNSIRMKQLEQQKKLISVCKLLMKRTK